MPREWVELLGVGGGGIVEIKACEVTCLELVQASRPNIPVLLSKDEGPAPCDSGALSQEPELEHLHFFPMPPTDMLTPGLTGQSPCLQMQLHTNAIAEPGPGT